MPTQGPLIIPTLPVTTQTFNSTLLQMRNKVYMGLRDDSQQFITPGMVNEFLNEGYLDLCARLRLSQATATGSSSATDGTVTLPTDFIEPTTFSMGAVPLQEATNDLFDSYALVGVAPSTVFYRFYNNKIETYPQQKNVAYILKYTQVPTRLINDTDVFADLPAELEIRLVHYGRGQCRYIEGDQADGDRYMAIYNAGIPSVPRAAFRFGRGPNELVPASGVFDDV